MNMNNEVIHKLFGNSGVRMALVGTLVVLSIFLLTETVSIAVNLDQSAHPAADVITVSGNGQATLPPDVAKISFSVQHVAATVAAAQTATTKQADAALTFVEGQGIAHSDVKTLSYNVWPQYSYQPCSPGVFCPLSNGGLSKITGYQVSETIQVTVHNLSSVGALIDGLGKLQVQNVSGPNFTLGDPTAGYDAARADAISKAKAQAVLLAGDLGISLGKIVKFSESSDSYPQSTGYSMNAAGAAASMPEVPAGENTYHASVSITYEIR